MHIRCGHCGREIEIDDLLSAADKVCPECGQAMFGTEARRGPEAPNRVVNTLVKATNWGAAITGYRIALEAEEVDHLPMVCMCCGAAAAERVPKRFWLRKQWPYSSSVLKSTLGNLWIDVPVPLCAAHRHEFWWQWLHLVVVLVGALAFTVTVVCLGTRQAVGAGLPFLTPQLEVGACVATIVLSLPSGWRLFRSLQISSTYQNYIELRNVAPAFGAALAEQRRSR